MNGDLRLAMLGSVSAARQRVPVGVAGFAACTDASVHRTPKTIPANTTAVLLVLDRPLGRGLTALQDLHRAGKAVIVTFAESGGMPMADLVDTPESLRAFFEICRLTDAALATTVESQEMLRGADAREVELIPPPCPVDDPRWDFSTRPELRHGIMVGTCDFTTHHSNHAAALLSLREVAAQTGEPVTVLRAGRLFDRRMVRQLRRHWPAGLPKVVSGPLPADRLVRLMATHKLVFQLEWAGGVGGVAAEALLAGVPCVGGHGATERIVFPELCGFGRTPNQLLELAAWLLGDPAAAGDAVVTARALAATHLSSDEARSRLAGLVDRATSRAGARRSAVR